MVDTLNSFRIYRDEIVSDVDVRNNTTVAGTYKYATPLGVNVYDPQSGDFVAGLSPSVTGGFVTPATNRAIIFKVPHPLKRITFLIYKMGAANVGTMTFDVRDETGAVDPTLKGTITPVLLGAGNGIGENLTFVFNEEVDPNKLFTLLITTSASSVVAGIRIVMYACPN